MKVEHLFAFGAEVARHRFTVFVGLLEHQSFA